MVKINSSKEFEAIASGDAVNNSMFLDTSDNVLKTKDNSGNVSSIGGSETHVKVYTSAAEQVISGGSDAWVDTNKTFTLSAPVDSYLVGIYFACELAKNVAVYGTQYARVNLKINGSNLGNKYIASIGASQLVKPSTGASQYMPFIDTSEERLLQSQENDTSYRQFNIAHFLPLKIEDSSTTFTVRMYSNSNDDVKLKNVNIIVMYATPVTED